MLREIDPNDSKELFDYYLATSVNTPYYYPVHFDSWHKSMFNDCDYDGSPLFSELKTFALFENGAIHGYIQFGISAFTFDENGQKNRAAGYGVVRGLHYLRGAKNGPLLMDKSMEYFDSKKIEKRHAFFHYLGMSCCARQGKLHHSGFYMESALALHAFKKEHENVYFTRCLQGDWPDDFEDIGFSNSDDPQTIQFTHEGREIGGCELFFVPISRICYLKWIYIRENLRHLGLGTKCMHKLFDELSKKGFVRLDTDTMDSNRNAQKYYEKTGFINWGIMRSYCT